MQTHTLIFSVPKLQIPEVLTIEFVINIIKNDLASIDYFGFEIDNQADYTDFEQQEVNDKNTYIDFNFSTPNVVEYKALSKTEIDTLILEIIENSESIELRADHKDVTIYL
ncbi:hypothetical protein MW871_14950 [Flavobacterium sp. I-SCBP12n]|uniref:Uncharacterized protein n=1 Tax=Flavobacterium pygoscelis TaxID=2893176 RepID=A0A9X2BR65_9FLAO|nr:hypothetical protein [Flavobacterium pygoscelis]MCK8143186.1 hypothetical protein [Flavobacterium pygoscelis]